VVAAGQPPGRPRGPGAEGARAQEALQARSEAEEGDQGAGKARTWALVLRLRVPSPAQATGPHSPRSTSDGKIPQARLSAQAPIPGGPRRGC